MSLFPFSHLGRPDIDESHQVESAYTDKLRHCRKHGTFRPSLMKLVQENAKDTVTSTTLSAFSQLDSPSSSPPFTDPTLVLQALKTLSQLRGIGPATASLLLSVCAPEEVPFFSDELFRWTCWDEVGKGKGKGGEGWDRVIKYNVKEYKEILVRVGAMRERLGVSAVDVEKVAYVLGSDRADVGVHGFGEEGMESVGESDEGRGERGVEKGGDMTEKRLGGIVQAIRDEEAKTGKGTIKHDKNEQSQVEPRKNAKRKLENKAPVEGTRKSARRKI